MDLTLNNLQRLICHKTQPTNQIAIIKNHSYLILVQKSKKLKNKTKQNKTKKNKKDKNMCINNCKNVY